MNPTDFVLLRLGPWALALPRRSVRDLLSPEAVQLGDMAHGGGASVRFGERSLPLLLLDDALQVASAVPAGRRICVVLDADTDTDTDTAPFALLCDEFEHKIDAGQGALVLHALPHAMRSPGSPVKGVLQYGQAVAAVTDAQALRNAFDAQLACEAAAA